MGNVRDSEIRLSRIVAVLQRCTHKFYFVLVAGDLRQKTPAGADNGYRDHRKFLDGRMGKRPHSCYCLNAE